MRTDQGSPAQRRQDPHADPRAPRARHARGLGMGAWRKPRACPGHASTAWRLDRRMDRNRRGLPDTLMSSSARAVGIFQMRRAHMSMTLNVNGTRRDFYGDP